MTPVKLKTSHNTSSAYLNLAFGCILSKDELLYMKMIW